MSRPNYDGKLTDADLELIHQERELWIANAYRTDRLDRDKAEQTVNAAYQAAGLEKPPITVWMDSPLRNRSSLNHHPTSCRRMAVRRRTRRVRPAPKTHITSTQGETKCPQQHSRKHSTRSV